MHRWKHNGQYEVSMNFTCFLFHNYQRKKLIFLRFKKKYKMQGSTWTRHSQTQSYTLFLDTRKKFPSMLAHACSYLCMYMYTTM